MIWENKMIELSCYFKQIEKCVKRNYTLKSPILFSIIRARRKKYYIFGHKIIMNIYSAHFSLWNCMWIALDCTGKIFHFPTLHYMVLRLTPSPASSPCSVCMCVCVCAVCATVHVCGFACTVITYLSKHELSPKIKCTYFELEAARHNF